MGNQYQNFVRAQMRTRETQLRNQTIQEDERKSRNIALGQMITTGITQGASFRKGLIENKMLGKTTESGEKMYEYGDSPDSTLDLIRRKLLPGKKDFKLTKAGELEQSTINEIASAPKRGTDKFQSTLGLLNNRQPLLREDPGLKLDSVTDDKTPILSKAIRKNIKPASMEAGAYSSIANSTKEIRAGVNPSLTQNAVDRAMRGKGNTFPQGMKNAGQRLSDRVMNAKAGGSTASSGIGLHSGSTPKALDILNNKTTALSDKTTALANSTQKLGNASGALKLGGKALGAINIASSTASVFDKNASDGQKLSSGVDAILGAGATIPNPFSPVFAGVGIAKTGIEMLMAGGRRGRR